MTNLDKFDFQISVKFSIETVITKNNYVILLILILILLILPSTYYYNNNEKVAIRWLFITWLRIEIRATNEENYF